MAWATYLVDSWKRNWKCYTEYAYILFHIEIDLFQKYFRIAFTD
jgi:hypothetical protein